MNFRTFLPYLAITTAACLIVIVLSHFPITKDTPQTEPPTNFENDSQWTEFIKAVGADEAYAYFGTINRVLDVEEQHNNAHIFGTALYNALGKDSILVCDYAFGAGCYHQLFAEILSNEGAGSMDKVLQQCKDNAASFDEAGDCFHALGHGLAYYYGMSDLAGALDECRKVEEIQNNRCADGVYMEHISPGLMVDVVRPHGIDPLEVAAICEGEEIPGFKRMCIARFLQWHGSKLSFETTLPNFMLTLKEFCPSLEDEYQVNYCHYNIGHYFISTGGSPSHDRVREQCQTGANEIQAKWCIAGAIDRLSDGTFDYQLTYEEFCPDITGIIDRKACARLAE